MSSSDASKARSPCRTTVWSSTSRTFIVFIFRSAFIVMPYAFIMHEKWLKKEWGKEPILILFRIPGSNIPKNHVPNPNDKSRPVARPKKRCCGSLAQLVCEDACTVDDSGERFCGQLRLLGNRRDTPAD